MEECRICLTKGKNLCSIFDQKRGKSFVEMIAAIANIKIIKHERITDKICRACKRKLTDSYCFKDLIVRSNASLHQRIDQHLKRINFNNINDIKIEIEFDELNTKPNVKKCADIDINLKNGENVSYNDTTIMKLNVKKANETTNHTGNRTLSVSEFLKTIKEEPDEFNDYYADDNDVEDEYLPPALKVRMKSYGKKCGSKKSYGVNKKDKLNKVMKTGVKAKKGIKPVYLEDLRLIPTKPAKIKRPPKKYKSYAREEICPYCGKLTKSLKSHILVHTGERKFKCEICSKGFFTDSLLKYHMKKHNKEKNIKCPKCIASFDTEKTLERHMLSHSDVKNFICETCHKGFKRRGALLRHMMSHNSANKSVKCELCKMSFFSKYGLRHHMRVHTGERPFNCELCSQPYSYKHDFNRHCFKKHGIFLKRRAVYVMNEEVLQRERALMKELMLRAHGIVKEGQDPNPFAMEGPQAALAFEQAMKVLENRPIPIDINF